MQQIKYFSNEDIFLLEQANKSRVDLQYYTDRHIDKSKIIFLIKSASEFYFKCRDIALKMPEKEIDKIREKF